MKKAPSTSAPTLLGSASEVHDYTYNLCSKVPLFHANALTAVVADLQRVAVEDLAQQGAPGKTFVDQGQELGADVGVDIDRVGRVPPDDIPKKNMQNMHNMKNMKNVQNIKI